MTGHLQSLQVLSFIVYLSWGKLCSQQRKRSLNYFKDRLQKGIFGDYNVVRVLKASKIKTIFNGAGQNKGCIHDMR